MQQEPSPARRILVVRDAPKAAPPPPTLGDYPPRTRAPNQRARAAASRLCAGYDACEEPCCAPAVDRAVQVPETSGLGALTGAAASSGQPRWADSWKPPQERTTPPPPRSKNSVKKEIKVQRDAQFEEDLRAHREALSLGAPAEPAHAPPMPAPLPASQHRPANPWNAYQRELKKRGLAEKVRTSYYMAKEGDRAGFDAAMRSRDIPLDVANSAWHIARRTLESCGPGCTCGTREPAAPSGQGASASSGKADERDQRGSSSQGPARECTERVERDIDSSAQG